MHRKGGNVQNKIIEKINKLLAKTISNFKCPKTAIGTCSSPYVDQSTGTVFFSQNSSLIGQAQEYCHEVWHWHYEDYKHYDAKTYPRVNGAYQFGINPDWDYREGRATFKSRELMQKFKLPPNITPNSEYNKAESYYVQQSKTPQP